jgi:hypothetical protein
VLEIEPRLFFEFEPFQKDLYMNSMTFLMLFHAHISFSTKQAFILATKYG